MLSTLNTKNSIRVAVGLSGGVDSSVAAYLLKKDGYAITGIHLVCWDYNAAGCTGEEDRADAVKLATLLEIPFKTLNFEKEYRELVMKNFYNEFKASRTPNPDILCNSEIKFGMFLEWAIKEGFDYVATGHYARVKVEDGSVSLLQGLDPKKDQSYFLYRLNQHQLKHTMFPLGALEKSEIRSIAKKQNFPTADKPDSVGICFVGDINIKEFLKKEIPENSGEVINSSGEIIGSHDGVAFYTIGQRHGFRINKYFGLPLYVISKNSEKNQLVVGFAKEGIKKEIFVKDINWIKKPSGLVFHCDVRIRHLGQMYSAEITAGENAVSCSVVFEDAVFGVAPGQSAAFYLKGFVLGGGIIA